MSILRVNNIEVRTGSAVTFSSNIDITGSFDAAGIVTARSGIHVTGGSVGIGTTNPTSNLHVIGEIKVGQSGEYTVDDSRVQHNVRITSPQFTGRGSDAYVDIKGDAGATSFVRVLDSGNVGIGSTIPTVPLDVAGAATFNGTLKQVDVANGTSLEMRTSVNNWQINATQEPGSNVAKGLYLRSTATDGTLQDGIYIKGTTSGSVAQVGIGTATPTAALDVNGVLALSGRWALAMSNDSDMLSIGGFTAAANLGISTVRMFTSDIERLRINENGKVILGTTTTPFWGEATYAGGKRFPLEIVGGNNNNELGNVFTNTGYCHRGGCLSGGADNDTTVGVNFIIQITRNSGFIPVIAHIDAVASNSSTGTAVGAWWLHRLTIDTDVTPCTIQGGTIVDSGGTGFTLNTFNDGENIDSAGNIFLHIRYQTTASSGDRSATSAHLTSYTNVPNSYRTSA